MTQIQAINPLPFETRNELNVLISLETSGVSKQTLKDTARKLKYLAKFADLNNPEEVKLTTRGYK